MKSRNFASKRLSRGKRKTCLALGTFYFQNGVKKKPRKPKTCPREGGKGKKEELENIADGGKLKNSSGSFVIFSTEG